MLGKNDTCLTLFLALHSAIRTNLSKKLGQMQFTVPFQKLI